MKRTLAATLAIAALAAFGATPAYAESEGTMAKQALMLPVRLVAMGAGMVVGVPVAIARRSSNRTIEFTESFAENIGGKEHIIPMAFASVMGVPFGLLVGTGEGVYAGGQNAVSHGWEKPFSLDSMSLASELESK